MKHRLIFAGLTVVFCSISFSAGKRQTYDERLKEANLGESLEILNEKTKLVTDKLKQKHQHEISVSNSDSTSIH